MSDIKAAFVSRWGEYGYLLEADFSQLEVIVLAVLSQDPQLMHDIRNKVDIHAVNAFELFGSNFTEQQRKLAKRLSFQLQYGSGPGNMAKKNGIDISVARKFISNYYNRYPGVKKWQEEVLEAVKKSRQPSDKRSEFGTPLGIGTYTSITGRKYVFQEYENTFKYSARSPTRTSTLGTREVSFKPTETANYPVQGFATGDIVPLVLGKLYRELSSVPELDKRVLLINTVHDSILLDCHQDCVDKAAHIVKHVMEEAPTHLKEEFGITFDLPLSVGIKIGRDWLEMAPYVV